MWLPKAIYDNAVYNASTNAMFVKNIAVAMFGDQYLREHSVKGKSCNKTKSTPRPAIDPTKAIAIYGRDKFIFNSNYNFISLQIIFIHFFQK